GEEGGRATDQATADDDEVGGLGRYRTSTISILVEPAGVSTETSSPTRLPSSALPTGDSSEIRPLLGSASADPTMVKASSPYSSCTLTVEPTSTTPLTCLPSMMLALRTSFSSSRMRPSTKPCSFLASSY